MTAHRTEGPKIGRWREKWQPYRVNTLLVAAFGCWWSRVESVELQVGVVDLLCGVLTLVSSPGTHITLLYAMFNSYASSAVAEYQIRGLICVTCCTRLWDNFHQDWPSTTYPCL